MLKRWIFYLAVLLGCTVFWAAHQTWMAWCLLRMVLWLPLFSLAVSLIPMLTTRLSFHCPPALPLGTDAQVGLSVKNIFPQPPYRWKLRVTHTLTGKIQPLKASDSLPAAHCGQLVLNCGRFLVYDYLGLFCLPLTRAQSRSVLIRPAVVPMESPKDLQRILAHAWQPKPGGGFAENHEMRLYRPGDGMNQVHWKLTAKTGKLMVREAMIPRCGRILLTLDIFGTAEELDRKLGRLLWLGNYLLEQSLSFEICAQSGSGLLCLSVTGQTDFEKAMDQLLCCSPLQAAAQHSDTAASWHFHIGGDPDEA